MKKLPKTKLGDHIDINHGFAFQGKFFSDVPTGYIVVTPGNFKSGGGFESSRFKYYDGAHGKFDTRYIFQPGDIIIALTDLGRETNILGYAARIPEITGETKRKQKFLHNQRIGRVVCLTNKINNDFLYWLLRSDNYHSYIIATSSGSTVKHTSPERIKEFGFLLPPLEKQIDAVHILNTIENKIYLLENTNAFLEKIIMEYFKRFFPNLNEYERRPLSEFGKIVCGKTPTKERSYNFFGGPSGPFPFIKISDLRPDSVYVTHTADSLSYEGAAIQKEKQIPADSICVSCIGTIGLVSLTANICYTNQQINAVIPHDDYQCYYLYCYLKMMRPQLEELSTGGSILLNLNTAGFSRLPIPGPPQSQLKIFYGFVHSIFKRIHLNSCYINHLIKARNFLQKRIFMEFFENDSLDW